MQPSRIHNLPFDATARFFSLGRHALLACLKILDLQPGQQVLLPAFMCRDCLAPLVILGAQPVFYAVDEQLRLIALPVTSTPRAIIVVNYFGFPQDLKPFEDFAAATGAAIIEDNAHGFLSCDKEGVPLGSRGDFGVFSLRKTFPLPDGAVLTVNRDAYLTRLPDLIPCRNDTLSNGFLIKQVLRHVQNVTGIRVRTLGELITRRLRQLRTGSLLPQPDPLIECKIPGDPAINCHSLEMLQQIDCTHEVARRRELYSRIERSLSGTGISPLFFALPPKTTPYGYPFRANAKQAAAVMAIARKHGLNCSRWPDLPSELEASAPDYYRNVWWVNFL